MGGYETGIMLTVAIFCPVRDNTLERALTISHSTIPVNIVHFSMLVRYNFIRAKQNLQETSSLKNK